MAQSAQGSRGSINRSFGIIIQFGLVFDLTLMILVYQGEVKKQPTWSIDFPIETFTSSWGEFLHYCGVILMHNTCFKLCKFCVWNDQIFKLFSEFGFTEIKSFNGKLKKFRNESQNEPNCLNSAKI